MNLSNTVRRAVSRINKTTKTVQATVYHQAWIAGDVYGSETFAPLIPYTAIVEEGTIPRLLPSGLELMTKAYLCIVQPVIPNGADRRTDPIDTRDNFILPSGLKGNVAATVGLDDRETNRQYFHEVWIGMK